MITVLIVAVGVIFAVLGLRSLFCACTAVLAFAGVLIMISADVMTALAGGLLAATYLVVVHLAPSARTWQALRAHATRAILFGGFAALVCANSAALPWVPVLVPLAVLAIVFFPSWLAYSNHR